MSRRRKLLALSGAKVEQLDEANDHLGAGEPELSEVSADDVVEAAEIEANDDE